MRDASSSVPATGATGAAGSQKATGTGSATSSGGGTSKPRTRKPLSSSDASAIDAELSAIEKELDSMALPSDSDFGGIESGLE